MLNFKESRESESTGCDNLESMKCLVYNTQNISRGLPSKRRWSDYLQSLSNLKTPTPVVLLFFFLIPT